MTGTYIAATDMSPRSDLALQRAVWLAERHGARLIVAHVVDDAAPPEIANAAREASFAALERFMKSLSDKVDIELRVDFGDPTADIVAMTEAEAPALLIVGAHRPRRFLDELRETTVQRLVRLTACPVLMVADRVDHGYDHVVAATDYSPSSTAAIRLASTLAPEAGITPVHAFHVPYSGLMSASSGGKDDVAASFRLEAAEDDIRWRDREALPDACGATVIEPGSVMKVLADQIKATGASLVTAGAHGRVGSARAILGSVATDLVRMPPCDVLIARAS